MNDPRPVAVPRVAPTPDPLIGRMINDRYKVLGLIARGGMGKVYRAEQVPLGRMVALKVLNASYVGENDPEFHKRFFLEASIASRLTHPNTVTIHDYGKTDDEVLYIAMELLEGRTLHRTLRDEGPFSPGRTAHVIQQICRALREAHGHGVIHRDLKPANVYLVQHGDERDFVKVLDFGLVKNLEDKGEQLTQTGLFMGSPKYMAPEQIRGSKVDARVDIYSLGVMMFEMLTGKVPFDDPNSVNILMAHVNDRVPAMHDVNPRANVAPQLEAITRKCMAKRPEERFSSMEEVLASLKQYVGSSITPPPGDQSALRTALRSPHDRVPIESIGGQTTTGPLFVQLSKPSGNGVALFLAGLFVLTGLGGFLALGHPFDKDPQELAPLPIQQPSAGIASASGLEGTEVADRSVLVSLRSTPPGATVLIEGQEYGPTPTQFELTGNDAAYGRVVKFVFRREGYGDVTVSRQIRGARLDVYAPPMEPLPPGASSKRSGRVGPPAPLGPVPPLAPEPDDAPEP